MSFRNVWRRAKEAVKKPSQHRRSLPTTPKPRESASAQTYSIESPMKNSVEGHAGKLWLEKPMYHSRTTTIKKPNELEKDMTKVSGSIPEDILDRIQGAMVGMAIGDALGAHVEFRPHEYLVAHPVTDMQGGGTWGLRKGQFTDDTSMALCLANSLVCKQDFNLYDQLVRYKWWYRHGYMSSTGECFDIGQATRESIETFEKRQQKFAKDNGIEPDKMDTLTDPILLKKFNTSCSRVNVAGNGALMRLAPVPLFFYRSPKHAVEYSGRSGQITHGDQKAYDACRYYAALITGALKGLEKEELLDPNFYHRFKDWFGNKELCPEILSIAKGSYQKRAGYAGGIRGGGYIVHALEAALWAFWSDGNSFEKGALDAVNLGDDTDTTAAIYGQLAGAFYGFKNLPHKWLREVYAKEFILNLSEWIAYEGNVWSAKDLPPLGGSSPTVTPTNTDSPVPVPVDPVTTRARARNRSHLSSVASGEKSTSALSANSQYDLGMYSNSPDQSGAASSNTNLTQTNSDVFSAPVEHELPAAHSSVEQNSRANPRLPVPLHKTNSMSPSSQQGILSIPGSNPLLRPTDGRSSAANTSRPAVNPTASSDHAPENGLLLNPSMINTYTVHSSPTNPQRQHQPTAAPTMPLASSSPYSPQRPPWTKTLHQSSTNGNGSNYYRTSSSASSSRSASTTTSTTTYFNLSKSPGSSETRF